MLEQNENCIEIVGFTLPKIKENPEDIQDAFSFSADRTVVAIADGTSTSLYPRQWADILVNKFCDDPNNSIREINENWQKWLKPLQDEWFKYFQYIQQDSSTEWIFKASQHKDVGSSTFVGLKLHYPDPESNINYWECLAIGDSCLFQIKDQSKTITHFPITKPEDFSSVTDAFHSRPEYNHNSQPRFMDDQSYEQGDIFLLATDALAEWIFKNLQNEETRWKELLNLSKEKEFSDLIKKLRADQLIKNDDTTFIRLKVMSIPQKKVQNLLPPASNPVSPSSVEVSLERQPKSPMPPSSQPNKVTPIQQLRQLIRLVLFSSVLIVSISGLNLLTNVVNLRTLRNSIKNNDLNKILIPVYQPDNNQPVGFVWRKNFNDILYLPDKRHKLLVYKFNLPPSSIDDKNKTLTIPKDSKIPLNKDKGNNEVGYLLPGTYKYSEFQKESYLLEVNVTLGE